jgi:hypothetical protein
MKKNIYILIFLLIFTKPAFSQLRLDTLGWIPPVDIPIVLSGNFAELRSGHFHSGIDIKTQGKEGFKVYAVQKGYVARIKVSASGYGNALYIVHPDGYTSVYGHLKQYNIQIEKYVRKAQYEQKSFEVDLFPAKGELPVNQGDIIALSGNSGSSGGPHLHFEVRDTKNSYPLNGLFLGYDIKDNIAPKMYYLYVYPQKQNSRVNNKSNSHYYSLAKNNGHYTLRQGDTLKASGDIAFGLKVDDYLNGAGNRCGVYKLSYSVNDSIYMAMQFDGVSFSETRYINTLMDYAENATKYRKVYRMFKEPNNKLAVYLDVHNRGILSVDAGKVYKIKIEALDAYFNKSVLEFYVEGEKPKSLAKNLKSSSIITIPWQKMFAFDSSGVSLLFPKNSLYDSINFAFACDTLRAANTYSPTYSIHNDRVPLQRPYILSINYDSVEPYYRDKLLIAKYSGDGKYLAYGGVAKQGKVLTQLRTFGNFVVTMDTLAPEIIPIADLAASSDLSNAQSIKLKITDNLSGVSTYNGYINGAWVLFQWDAKNNLLFYEFDENIPNIGSFELKIEAVDDRGNKATFIKQCSRNII